ncbi:unnamed protein product [Closterium sp. NIES-54]
MTKVPQEVREELTSSVRVPTQDRKVFAEPLAELETDCADPRDQDIGDLTIVAQEENCGVSTVTRANDIRAATTTQRRPTLRKPLTKLLGRRGLAPTLLLLLPLATSTTSPQKSSSPTATTPTSAATATPTAATTATTKAPTPATTPTTSTVSTTSIAAPTTTPASTATTPATLALAAAALPTSRSSPDILSTKDVNSSNRGVGGSKGGGATPLKEGRARSPTSGTYSEYTSLSCKEVLLE